MFIRLLWPKTFDNEVKNEKKWSTSLDLKYSFAFGLFFIIKLIINQLFDIGNDIQ